MPEHLYKTIGFLAPMQEELIALLSRFPESEKTEKCLSGMEFHHINHHGTKIIAACSGVGKVNTARSATTMILKFSPDCIINVGVAGGMHPDMNVNDRIAADSFIHTDADVTVLGFEPGQLLGEPAIFEADSFLLDLVRKLEAEGKLPIPVKIGCIGSADSFISRQEQVDYIRKTFHDKVVCVEMEGAALAQVCHRFQTPLFALRTLSDIACTESDNAVDFKTFLPQAADSAALFARHLIDELAVL